MDRSEQRLRRRLARELAPYRPMLEALVTGELSPGKFEIQFFDMWGDDRRSSPKEVFRIFEDFFFVVEDYVDNPAIRDPARGDLGPEELKERARELLRRAGFDLPSRP